MEFCAMKKILKRFWKHMTQPSSVIWAFMYSFFTYFISSPSTKYLSFVLLAISIIFLAGMIYQKKKTPTI